MPRSQSGVGRRALLKASIAGCALANLAAVAGDAAADPASPTPPGAADVQRVALIYGADLSAGDAEKVAAAAAGVLASLHYLALLKSDDVQPAFGYPALVAEALRGLDER
jgi:hypothetical protein